MSEVQTESEHEKDISQDGNFWKEDSFQSETPTTLKEDILLTESEKKKEEDFNQKKIKKSLKV